ncbi:MAG: nitroreductase family protein [Asgard group archaeon]|nr:nitroreductase family protein [Asgard group archaeon]
MELKETIEKRRAYKALIPIEVTDELINDLAKHAQLAPSCFNNQPWRYVFIHGKENLEKFYPALTGGNAWAQKASMIVAVFSKQEFDCIIKDKIYFLFDTGMATAFLILRATDLGLVAHPMAGFNEDIAKEILNIPPDMKLIAIIGIGKHNEDFEDVLEENQIEHERNRPIRMNLNEFIYHNRYEKTS